MLAYVYDEITKEYIGSISAQKDPLETEIQGKDVYLLPASSTFKKPLLKKEGYAIIYNNDMWQYIVDNRGKSYINSDGIHVIKDLYFNLSKLDILLSEEQLALIQSGQLFYRNGELTTKSSQEYLLDIRNKRDYLINTISWRIDRYNEQIILGIKTSDSKEVYYKLLEYKQYLRDIPQTISDTQQDLQTFKVLSFEEWLINN